MTEKVELTDEQKAEEKLKHQKNATKKKGRNIIVLQKVENAIIPVGNGADSKTEDVFKIIATENEGLRTIADVKKWMESVNFIGTGYPVRIQAPITRGEQKIIKFS